MAMKPRPIQYIGGGTGSTYSTTARCMKSTTDAEPLFSSLPPSQHNQADKGSQTASPQHRWQRAVRTRNGLGRVGHFSRTIAKGPETTTVTV